MKRTIALMALLCSLFAWTPSYAADQKPNILVIMGDDIGIFNIGAYHRGMLGYNTPNIDRFATEGRSVHDLLRAAELHRGPLRLHHRVLRSRSAIPSSAVRKAWATTTGWYRRAFIAVPVQDIVGKTLMTFKDFPPRQKPASFTIDQAMEALMRSTSGGASK